MRKIKKIVATDIDTLSFVDEDIPTIQPHQALVQGLFSGISHATELAVINGTTPSFHKKWDKDLRCYSNRGTSKKYPSSLGYEYIGRIVDVGVTVSELQKGDIVWMDAPHQTYNILDISSTSFIKVHDSTKLSKYTLLALTRVALNAVHDAKPKIGDTFFVSGLGTIGLIVVQLLKYAGVNRIFASDTSLVRRNKAETYEAVSIDPTDIDVGHVIKEQSNGGVDTAIECSGNTSALHDAVKSCRTTGTVVTVASYRDEARNFFMGEEWHRNRITLLSSMSVNDCPHRNAPLWNLSRLNDTAKKLIEENVVDTLGLITHTFDFNDAEKAYAVIKDKQQESIKVILQYNHDY